MANKLNSKKNDLDYMDSMKEWDNYFVKDNLS